MGTVYLFDDLNPILTATHAARSEVWWLSIGFVSSHGAHAVVELRHRLEALGHALRLPVAELLEASLGMGETPGLPVIRQALGRDLHIADDTFPGSIAEGCRVHCGHYGRSSAA